MRPSSTSWNKEHMPSATMSTSMSATTTTSYTTMTNSVAKFEQSKQKNEKWGKCVKNYGANLQKLWGKVVKTMGQMRQKLWGKSAKGK